MSIIEQAARRVEELRRSGIDVPQRARPSGGAAQSPVSENLPARAARRLQEAMELAPLTLPPGRLRPRPLPSDGPAPATPRARSKTVEIDLARLAQMGYLTPDKPRAQISDEFRVIKRPLLLNLNSQSAQAVQGANLIMVTSSLASEGKTFVAINLAISMAMELDKSVLLVDADVSRPSVLSRLGLGLSVGLLDVLADPSIQMSDVLLKTSIEQLTILPAGAPRGRATEMLASDTMSRLLAEIATRYSDRIIVFDAPPLLPSPESRVLATRMGQVILVVEAESTPQRTVMHALSTVESCPNVMTLLNKASHSEIGFYYGYYSAQEG